MTQTANRRRKVQMPSGIRKKFAAAICMLLIAAIMMISSTYAWFTLSTAPEVTGITTNVGANGNLEIALLNASSFASSADDLGIKTNVGDSMVLKPATEANITWGNLVDLSDSSYGLERIILNPAALNLKTVNNEKGEKLSGQIIQGGLTSPLVAPNYGADGRVINVQKNTTVGIYNNGKFEEALTGAGVRAIGVSSGITVRVSSYRAAVSQITVNMAATKAAAQKSLVDHGQDLASLLVTAMADSSYTLTAADAAAIMAVKADLLEATGGIADAIRQAALAKYLSAANSAELSDDDVLAKVQAFEDAPLSNLATLADGVDISFLNDAITAYNNAQSKIEGISVTAGQTYTEAAPQFYKLLDRDYTNINGVDGSTVSMENIGELLGAIVGAGKVIIEMKSGSGIYADMAEIVGNYTASGLYITVTYNGIAVDNMATTMHTNVSGTAMLVTAGTAAAAGDPTGAGGSTAVDDTYGYIIDFGFRTNAANSSLLLQQDARQRIYSDSVAELTNGEGSYLQFTTADTNAFSKDDVLALMSALRVVFVTPNDTNDGYEILGVAAINVKYAINDSTGLPELVTADGRFDQLVSYEESGTTATVYGRLYMFDLEDTAVQEIVADKEYSMTLGKIKTTGEDTTLAPDFSIVELTQNKAKKVSALVYLDGDIVDNTMVANAVTSMNGKINLQFASSAELIPMENTALKSSGNEDVNVPDSVDKTQLSAAIATIKANEIYTTAAAAAEPTGVQAELLSKVAAAEAVAANENATANDVKTAAINLALAYHNAGGENPFAE